MILLITMYFQHNKGHEGRLSFVRFEEKVLWVTHSIRQRVSSSDVFFFFFFLMKGERIQITFKAGPSSACQRNASHRNAISMAFAGGQKITQHLMLAW